MLCVLLAHLIKLLNIAWKTFLGARVPVIDEITQLFGVLLSKVDSEWPGLREQPLHLLL